MADPSRGADDILADQAQQLRLLPGGPFVILGPQLGGSSVRPLPELAGQKAAGLWTLPSGWTPPFFVVTTAAHSEWVRSQPTAPELVNLLDDDSNGAFTRLVEKMAETGQVIVRSSATSEGLQERGRFDSLATAATPEAVAQVLLTLWIHCRETAGTRSMALVVQAFVRARLAGHMSNERRVSSRSIRWLCEYHMPGRDLAGPDLYGAEVLRVFLKDYANIDSPLSCQTEGELWRRIRQVGALRDEHSRRAHFEWLWDGDRIWIVQRDLEERMRGRRPGSSWTPYPACTVSSELRLFASWQSVTHTWRKIENLRNFQKCGLPCPEIYVLEDPETIAQLACGNVTDTLRSDVDALCLQPVVVRTDVAESTDIPSVLLPRSDTLKTAQEAQDFLTESAAKLKHLGAGPTECCFILHHFLLATSCSQSLASPDSPRVRIDSTWGIPDSLLYYSHDSFDVNLSSLGESTEHIRCKSEFLDVTNDGAWVETHTGYPWDWEPSLTDDERAQIARYTAALAQHLQCPVQLMCFVGVHQSTGQPPILPWYFTTKDIASLDDIEEGSFWFRGARLAISTLAELEYYEQHPEEFEGRLVSLRLRPAPKLMHDREFVERTAHLAVKHNVPIELEGSILSHAYYVLTKAKARVRCLDPLRPYEVRQEFGKLVRDRVPDVIRSHGESVRTAKAAPSVHVELLKGKAVEEALELFAESGDSGIFAEMADVLEVLKSLCRVLGRDFSELLELADRKREQRGGFEHGLVLVETRASPVGVRPNTEGALSDSGVEGTPPILSDSNSLVVTAQLPRWQGRSIRIPLVPPQKAVRRAYRFPLTTAATELVITYGPKDSYLLPKSSAEAEAGTQPKLFGSAAGPDDNDESSSEAQS